MASIVTWHITNSANEWGILNSSFAEVFMILLSYHRIGCGCDQWNISPGCLIKGVKTIG